MPEYLFLYGTLLPNKAPTETALLVNRLRRVGPARVAGRLYDLGEYPGAILDPAAKTSIHGELFELPEDPAILRKFDRYEEFDRENRENSLFIRTRTRVKTEDGRMRESWVYVYNQNPGRAPRIVDGDYSLC